MVQQEKSICVFPLGLGYLKNVLKEDCDIIDMAIDTTIDPQQIAALVGEYDFLGVAAWGFNVANVVRFIDQIKQLSDIPVIVGGPSAASVTNADHRILGEGEEQLKAFLSAEDKSSIEASYPDHFVENLDDFGIVDYSGLRIDDYYHHGYKDWLYTLKDKNRSAPIMATRGCPYKCTFCSAPNLMGKKVRAHSSEYIVETIDTLYHKHEVRQISFLDDNLTFDMDYAKSLVEEIVRLQERKGMHLVCTTLNGVRLNRLDEELLRLMKRAGWGEIVIAPESGSAETLKRMKKALKLPVVDEKIDLIKRVGLNVAAYFIVGYPGDQKSDLDKTREYILNSNIDRAIVNLFNPIPDTPIADQLLESGQLNTIDAHIGYKNLDEIQYLTPGLQQQDVDEFMIAVQEKTRFTEMWFRDLPQ